jgi:hypothetical protein
MFAWDLWRRRVHFVAGPFSVDAVGVCRQRKRSDGKAYLYSFGRTYHQEPPRIQRTTLLGTQDYAKQIGRVRESAGPSWLPHFQKLLTFKSYDNFLRYSERLVSELSSLLPNSCHADGGYPGA